MSLTIRGGRGIFRWFGALFRKGPDDPISKNIYDAVAVIDKMISVIDITRRSLLDAQEEHSRKAKLFASQGKKQYEGIFLEELKHIGGILSLLEKVRVDLIRVKTRLRTIATMEKPLMELPEVIEEIRSLRPQVEKIMPQLTAMILEVERKVEDVMISTSLPYGVGGEKTVKNMSISTRQSNTPLPPLPPSSVPAKSPVALRQNTVSLSTVKKWILTEIKSNGGILDISSFTRKYGVSKSVVFTALHQLENEGKIRLSR